MTNWAGPGPIGGSQALMGHHVSHERGGGDEMTALFDEIDDTNAVITQGFVNVLGLLSLDYTTLSGVDATEAATRAAADTALTAAIAALGHGIVQVQYAVAASVNSGTGFTDIVTKAITVGAGGVIILAQGNISEAKSGANDIHHLFELVRDTTIIGVPQDNLWGGDFGAGGNAGRTSATLIHYEVPGAGTYTYRIKGAYANYSTSGTPTANGNILIVELSP